MSNRTAMLAAVLGLGGLLIFAGPVAAQLSPVSPAATSTAVPATAPALPAFPEPTLITLDMQQVSPQAAFEELGRQAGVEFALKQSDLWQQLGDSPIDVHINKAGFLTALRMLSKQSGIAFTSSGDRRIMLTQAVMDIVTVRDGQRITRRGSGGVTMNGPLSLSSPGSPFMFMALRLARISSVDPLHPDGVNRSMQFVVQCFADPKVHLLGTSSTLRLSQAVDEKGKSLLLRDEGDYEPDASSTGWMWQAQCRLSGSLNVGSRISRLRGTIRVRMATRSERLEFDNPLVGGDVEKTVGGLRCTLGAMTSRSLMCQGPFTIWRDGRDDQAMEELRQSFANHGGPQLLDDNGRSFINYGVANSTLDPQKLQMTLRFYLGSNGSGAPGLPKKIVWDIPLEVKDVDVPVEFVNLPLP